MSNCIEFQDDRLVLSSADLDLDGLMEMIQSHRGHGYDRAYHQEQSEIDECTMIYWYLSERNVQRFVNDPSHVMINLQSGESTHTWKSFTFTLTMLNRRWTGPTRTVEFVIEDDGFPGWFRSTWYLGKDLCPRHGQPAIYGMWCQVDVDEDVQMRAKFKLHPMKPPVEIKAPIEVKFIPKKDVPPPADEQV